MAKILLVEDDIILQKMYRDKLLKESYEVILASDGQAGFEKAKNEQPDLILLDLMLPKTDGITALKMLKGDEKTSQIPVAILTVVPIDSFDDDAQELLKETVAYWRKDDTNPSFIVGEIKKLLASASPV